MKNIADEYGENEDLLTLDERMRMVAQSKAFSPESAAAMVKAISEMSPASIMDHDDIDILSELTNGFEGMDPDVELTYRSFCGVFRINTGNAMAEKLKSTDRPVYGTELTNAIVYMTLLWIEGGKGVKRNKQEMSIYMKMTFEDYLDALIDICFTVSGKRDNDRCILYRGLKRSLIGRYDLSKPLTDALADILKDYIDAWKEFDRLDYISRCDNDLKYHLNKQADLDEIYGSEDAYEDECSYEGYYTSDSVPEAAEYEICESDDDNAPDEEARAVIDSGYIDEYLLYIDPFGYYYDRALNYPEEDLPDPYKDLFSSGMSRRRLFLSENTCEPEYITEVSEGFFSGEIRGLFEKYADPERLRSFMRRIDTQVILIERLLIEPFREMDKYHYEKHIGCTF